MSAPGRALDQDFTAVRSAGSRGGAGFLDSEFGVAEPNAAAAAPAGGANGPAQASQPARSVRPVAAPSAGPMGLTVSGLWAAAVKKGRELVLAKPEDRDATFGEALKQGALGVPAEIGHEFMSGLDALKKDFTPGHWDALTTLLFGPVAPGAKVAMDAIGTAFSPLTGLLTSGVGRPAEQLTGVKREVIGNLLAMAVPGGALGKGGKAAKLAAEAGDVRLAAEGADAVKPARAAATPIEKGGPPKPAAAAKPMLDPQAPVPDSGPGRAFDIAGDRPGADFKVTPELRQRAADFLAGKRETPIDVHLDALADPASRASAVNDLAKIVPKDGVKPIDVTQAGAYALNLTPSEVMTAIRPNFASDETFAAAVMVQNSAAETFWKAAQKAVASGSAADAEEATRAYALFNEYSGALRDAKTDWGRAGRIQQEAAGYRSEWTKNIQQIIEDVGPENLEEVIKKTAALDDPRKVSGFVSSLRWMSGREGLLYGWYNWLLSSPSSHFWSAASNTALSVFNVAVRYTAEKAFGNAVKPGEAMAMLYGYRGAFSDALKAAGKALRAGQSQFYGDYQSLFDGKLFGRTDHFAKSTPEGFTDAEPTKAAMEYLRMAMPTSWMGAADDFFKVMNYRAEIHAGLYRQGLARGMKDDELAQYIGENVNNVPQDLHDFAVAQSVKATLQEPLDGFALAAQETVDKFNIPIGSGGFEIPLGRIISPFTKTMSNVMRFAYRSSPLPLVAPSANFRAAMAAGGVRRELALAQVGLGTGISVAVLPFILGGQITGGGPKAADARRAWLQAGNQPYSIRVGNTWVQYNRTDPFATQIGMMADTFEIMSFASEQDNGSLAASLVLSVGHALTSKTYMQGWANLLDAMEDPERRGKKYVENTLASWATPSADAAFQRLTDEYVRAHDDLMSAVKARTPGLAQNLPPLRDLWGNPIKRPDGLFGTGGVGRMLAITGAPADNAEPIDKWIWEHRNAFPGAESGRIGLSAPPRTLTVSGGPHNPLRIALSLQQLDRLRVLAGNEAKNPATGLGAKDTLNALVSGSYPDAQVQNLFDAATPERQALMILTMWGGFREAARQQLLAEDATLRDTIGQAQEANRELIAPDLGGSP